MRNAASVELQKKARSIHRNEYDSILFIGNGLSDRCGAREADSVFPKSSLYRYCIRQDITCHFFENFREILSDLKKRIRGVLDLDGTLIEAYEAIYLGLKRRSSILEGRVSLFSNLRKYLKADLEATLSHFFGGGPQGCPHYRGRCRKRFTSVTPIFERGEGGA